MLIHKNNLSVAGTLAIWLAASAGVQSAAAQSAAATTPTPISFTRSFTFPAVGLAGTETLEVTVANLVAAPTSSTATASCTGTVSFSNASGAAIGAPAKFTVGAGQIFPRRCPSPTPDTPAGAKIPG